MVTKKNRKRLKSTRKSVERRTAQMHNLAAKINLLAQGVDEKYVSDAEQVFLINALDLAIKQMETSFAFYQRLSRPTRAEFAQAVTGQTRTD